MNYLPKSIRKLVDYFDRLPGIGPKHATRLALYLVNHKEFATEYVKDINTALQEAQFCSQCQVISDGPMCHLCQESNRDQQSICVVAHAQDIEQIEHTGKYNGTYHVLHGSINPVEGITPDHLTIKQLLKRIKNNEIKEVILALDATSTGEATSIYLKKILLEVPISVTRLARGIPVGSSIEYTDEVTLSSALENRK